MQIRPNAARIRDYAQRTKTKVFSVRIIIDPRDATQDRFADPRDIPQMRERGIITRDLTNDEWTLARD